MIKVESLKDLETTQREMRQRERGEGHTGRFEEQQHLDRKPSQA